MATSIQNGQTATTLTNKRTAWRIINIVIVLFAFFSPWLIQNGAMGQNLSGFQLMEIVGYFIVRTLSEMSLNISTFAVFLMVPLLAFLLLITVPLYCTLNLLVVVSNTTFTEKPIWVGLGVILLGISVIGFVIFILFIAALQLLLWGYWLTCIGLVSCIFWEILTYPSRRRLSKRE
jgi:hypothetical protein